MAGTATGAKRARAAAFSEHERYMHKSGVVLQREGKKIRAFLVRKAVAQLKQTREQHATATQAAAAADNDVDEKKQKRLQGKATKLFHQVEKLEKELAALKTLDLKTVVARAFEKTGLKVDEPVEEDESESDSDTRVLSAHDREMAKYGRGRVVEDKPEKHAKQVKQVKPAAAPVAVEEDEDEDDGFNSEDYDEAPRSGASDASDSDEEANSDSEDANDSDDANDSENDSEDPNNSDEGSDGGIDSEAESDDEEAFEEQEDEELHVVEAEEIAEGAILFGPQGPPGMGQPEADSTEPDAASSNPVDAELIDQLVDRVLAHNQMKPFLDAIRQYVEKKERDEAKKRRQKEKSALKRARASMVGGRSSAAPKSMFFGSLSGGVPDDDDDDDMGFGRGSMAGAEDDIADFLGETKKKKNRAGQQARRQKAIRMEEAKRRDTDSGDAAGGFQKRRFISREAPSIGKYGPSERPKKQQKKESTRGPKPRDGEQSSWRQDRGDARGNREFTPATGGRAESRPERRGRTDAPRAPPAYQAPKPAARAPPQRKPEAEPSHPSWLAKQAMKEKMKVDINAFSGKKITFGDD